MNGEQQKPTTSNPAELLLVDNLHKSFGDASSPIEVLKGANLSLRKGKHVSITGQSGSGKSTFLNIICGLESFEEGAITWNGISVKSLHDRDLSKLRGSFFGFIFQSYYLISELNTLENVLIAARLIQKPTRETRNRAKSLLELVGLKDRLNHHVQKLSGGERQRVAIARALMNQPDVILADEPTGNLDESTADEVMQLIFDVCKTNGNSLLLVTHNPEFAKLTDQQFMLHDGVLNAVR
jgi:lipoprotein-releasing system ATP-binding protein